MWYFLPRRIIRCVRVSTCVRDFVPEVLHQQDDPVSYRYRSCNICGNTPSIDLPQSIANAEHNLNLFHIQSYLIYSGRRLMQKLLYHVSLCHLDPGTLNVSPSIVTPLWISCRSDVAGPRNSRASCFVFSRRYLYFALSLHVVLCHGFLSLSRKLSAIEDGWEAYTSESISHIVESREQRECDKCALRMNEKL